MSEINGLECDLLSLLVGLPWHIVRDVMYYLPNEYICDVFFKVPDLRGDVIREFFPELHFGLNKYNGGVSGRAAINDVLGYKNVVSFLRQNPDVVPRALYISVEEPALLKDLLLEFEAFVSQVPHLHIRIMSGDTVQVNAEEFHELEGLENLESLVLRTWSDPPFCFSNFQKLKTFALLEPRIKAWPSLDLPESVETLHVETWDLTSFKIPPNVVSITWKFYLAKKLELRRIDFPTRLTTLVLVRCTLPQLDITALPRTLVHLNISYCRTRRVLWTSERRWPSKLEELILKCNNLDNNSLKSLSLSNLPDSLRVLNLGNNGITQFYHLKPLPKGLKTLDISENPLESLKDPTNEDGSYFYRFPDGLQKLLISNCRVIDRDTDPTSTGKLMLPQSLLELDLRGFQSFHWSYFAFPKSLERLTIAACTVADLQGFEEPSNTAIDGYATTWSQLEKLEMLNLRANSIHSLAGWRPPPRLVSLNFSANDITELSHDTPLFDRGFVDSMKRLREVNLSRNLISHIGEEVFLPPNLKELILSSNKLSSFKFTDGILNSGSLDWLSLYGNNLKEVSADTEKRAVLSSIDLRFDHDDSEMTISLEQLYKVFAKIGLRPCKDITGHTRRVHYLEPESIIWDSKKVFIINPTPQS